MSVFDEIIKSLASPQGNASTAATTYRVDAKEKAKGAKLIAKSASDTYLKVRSIPTRVLMTPGVATTYSSFGLYMPRLNSTVGDEMDLLASTLTAPFDAELVYGAGWAMRHPLQTAKLVKTFGNNVIDLVDNYIASKRGLNLDFSNAKETSWFLDVVSKIGEEKANKLVDFLKSPEGREFIIADKSATSAAGDYKSYNQLKDLIAEMPASSQLGGSAALSALGTIERPSIGFHDADFNYLVPGLKSLYLLSFSNLHKEVPALFKFIPKLVWRRQLFPVQGTTPNYPITRRFAFKKDGMPVDIFINDKSLPTGPRTVETELTPADRILDAKLYWTDRYPDATRVQKDIKDLTTYKPYGPDNLVIDPITGKSLFSPMLFEGKVTSAEGYPNVSFVETYPGSGERVPVIMNWKGLYKPVGNIINLKELDIISAWREAAAKGDKEAGNKALLEWWKLKTEQNPTVYAHDSKVYFNEFDSSKFGGTDEGFNGIGFYFGKTRPYTTPFAERPTPAFTLKRFPNAPIILYYGPNGETGITSYGPIKRFFYLNGEEKPLTSFDGASSHNFFNDSGWYKATSAGGNEIVVGHPLQIKLAEPFTYDDEDKLIDIIKRFDFSNPDIRYYKEGEMLPSSSNTRIEYAPYKGTDEQLLEEALNGVYDSLEYPNTPHFEKQALLVFDKNELPELKREMTELNQLSGLGVKRYDEGLHLIGENSPSAIWDPNDNILVESYVTINPDFAGKVSPYTTASHEVGGHGFNGHMSGLEDLNIVNKFTQLKQQGFSDKQILLAAISYLTKGKGLEVKAALDQAWGYLFATKYPKIYKMMQYNALKQRELLRVKSGVTVSKYKSDPDELATRARTGHILAAALNTEAPVYTDDMVKLEDSYTPESLKAYLKVALGLLPFLGLGTASSVLTKPNNLVEKIL